MEILRCIFTQLAIIFKHDLRLSKCQSWCSVSAIGDYGRTALHTNATSQHTSITEKLLEAGADSNIFDDLGSTPLFAALSLETLSKWNSY